MQSFISQICLEKRKSSSLETPLLRSAENGIFTPTFSAQVQQYQAQSSQTAAAAEHQQQRRRGKHVVTGSYRISYDLLLPKGRHVSTHPSTHQIRQHNITQHNTTNRNTILFRRNTILFRRTWRLPKARPMPTSATLAVFLAAKPQQKPIPKPNETWAGTPDSIRLWEEGSKTNNRHAKVKTRRKTPSAVASLTLCFLSSGFYSLGTQHSVANGPAEDGRCVLT